MKAFLEYVAEDIIAKYGTNLSRIAVVFPNKRASLFLNEYLAREAGKPIWSPAYLTISDLFRSHSTWQVADSIKLICDLHKCFIRQTGFDETLDHFYGWGQILLADFDDLDKNMAPAEQVFANLKNLRELDDVSYLTQEQKEIIRKFFSNFSEEHNSQLKERFLRLWSHIGDIYTDFNEVLASQGLAYEGALYRKVALDETANFEYEKYLFVGFNMVQKVEQTVFKTLMQQGKAHFYWDFDYYYMPETMRYAAKSKLKDSNQHGRTTNEAGYYIAQYLEKFPNELDLESDALYNRYSMPKDVTCISASTENIQARFVTQWLRANNRLAEGRRTAIVLCDESLLPAVIHALPQETDKVNITTGYPLSQTPIAGFFMKLFTLRTLGYSMKSDAFRLKYVNSILKHPYARYISSRYAELLQQLNEDKKYYPSCDFLAKDEGLKVLFSAPNSSGNEPSYEFTKWVLDILQVIASNSKEEKEPLFQESLFRTYTLMNRLSELITAGDLHVNMGTLQRLVSQLTTSTTIPFHGEPAVGLQIMGVLETRNIDFDHVLILSCNEGNMPKGVNDTSFLPFSIRKTYDLTTVDHKIAIYAYYFHRLMQRASDVTLTYNNATNDGKTGEMSRFMLQLMVESPHKIRFKNIQAGQNLLTQESRVIHKTPHIMELLKRRFDKACQQSSGKDTPPLLTPTAINRYLRCHLQFYYNYVGGLREPDNQEDGIIDNRIFGNIFHESSQRLYEKLIAQKRLLVKSDFERLLKSRHEIEKVVDEVIGQELFNTKNISGSNSFELNGMQMINREVIIHYLQLLLKTDMELAPFTIIGLEYDVKEDLCVGEFTTTIGGRIDRLDQVTLMNKAHDGTSPERSQAERIRVIDYKTGSRKLRPLTDVEAIFDPANIPNHSDYYLQTFIYANIVRHSTSLPVSPALLFIQHAGAESYDPTLTFGNTPILDVAESEKLFSEHLHQTIEEIFNLSVPFTPTPNDDVCKTCPYFCLCKM